MRQINAHFVDLWMWSVWDEESSSRVITLSTSAVSILDL